ncbi:MAG: hypothetical protein MRK01_00350 [Candidatus Scalindua sp.]|nr:hypothetical protein [Candidatus Scalindua sp.]
MVVGSWLSVQGFGVQRFEVQRSEVLGSRFRVDGGWLKIDGAYSEMGKRTRLEGLWQKAPIVIILIL